VATHARHDDIAFPHLWMTSGRITDDVRFFSAARDAGSEESAARDPFTLLATVRHGYSVYTSLVEFVKDARGSGVV
jgi:hypothetical protein